MKKTETREARRARLLEMKKNMTLEEIAALEGCSRQNISRIIGGVRTTPNPILLDVHAFIRLYEQEHKIAPSIPEIAEHFPTTEGKARSTSVVNYWLDQMEELKMIHPRVHGRARSIRSRALPNSNVVQAMQAKAE